MSKTDRIECKHCHKMVASGNMAKHLKTKKCKNYNDKTAGQPPSHTPSKPEAVSGLPASAPAESQSKVLTEIDLNTEFKTMATKFEKKNSEDKEKKYKLKCGECGEYFNMPGTDENGEPCCPFCGK